MPHGVSRSAIRAETEPHRRENREGRCAAFLNAALMDSSAHHATMPVNSLPQNNGLGRRVGRRSQEVRPRRKTCQ